MSIIRLIGYFVVILGIILIPNLACAPKPTQAPTPTPSPPPAGFAVTNLDIEPNAVMPGDPVTVTATIENSEETEGVYTAILTMDKQELESKDVSVGPGATATAVFKVTSPKAGGNYQLSVGEVSSTLRVFYWVAYALQYDHNRVDKYWASFEGYGYLSYFQIPSNIFKIQKIKIYGFVGGQNLSDWKERNFTLRIWNKELNQELWSQSCPYDLFSTTANWAEIEIPDIRVDGDFCVEVVTNAERMAPGKPEAKCALYIGLDLSAMEAHSDYILNGVIQPWLNDFGLKEKAAWMIRVEGEGGPKLERYTLSYDDGAARDCISAYPPIMGGYLVDFSPTVVPFIIKKVRIYGAIYGSGWEGKDFEVQIWDEDHNVLHSATYPVTKFAAESPAWIEVEIPDIEVSDKFYVHVYTGTGRMQGVHIGADDSVFNSHSNVTVREGDITKTVEKWPYGPSFWFGDKSKVNWMIRVVGTIMVTQE